MAKDTYINIWKTKLRTSASFYRYDILESLNTKVVDDLLTYYLLNQCNYNSVTRDEYRFIYENENHMI